MLSFILSDILSMRIRCCAVLLSVLMTGVCGATAVAQAGVEGLSQQLNTAVEAQNWDQAIKVIDQMIPALPGQATELKRYRSKLLRLQKRGTPGGNRTLPLSSSGSKGEVQIKRRQSGVPIVDVVFNRRRTFEMMVDSGASLTVITRPMAKELGITPDQIVETITVSTANGTTQMPIVYMKSIGVGGYQISQVEVAIAGPDMDIGLLGQDFLERYDVVLKRNSVQFRPRASN